MLWQPMRATLKLWRSWKVALQESVCDRMSHLKHLPNNNHLLYIPVKNLNLLWFTKLFRNWHKCTHTHTHTHTHTLTDRQQCVGTARPAPEWMNKSCMGNSVNARLNPSPVLKPRQRLSCVPTKQLGTRRAHFSVQSCSLWIICINAVPT